jgi:hypothetical protein
MQAVHQPPSSRPSREPGAVLVPLGVILTLGGVTGDLLFHSLGDGPHQREALIILGAGNNPWHLVLFAGIVVTALGGIRWATRRRSEVGSVLAAAMVLLLGTVMILGAWTGWNARTSRDEARAAAAERRAASGEEVPGSNSPEGASFLGEHDHAFGGPGAGEADTARERQALQVQLAAAKRATARYRDIDVARADGYIQVTQFIPTLGLHLAKLSQYSKPFDPTTPSVLLYEPDGTGEPELVGVAYSLKKSSETPPEGFAGSSDHWHYHRNLCFLLNGTVTITPTLADCSARNGIFQKETNWLLHAWIWKPNPAGVFVETNFSVL